MTALGKLFRTTVFKLSLAYLVIFGMGAGLVLGGLAWNVNILLDEQIGQTVQAEIAGLAEQYETGGIRHLVEIIERRTAQPGSSLYLVTNFAGETLAGNVATLPAGVIDHPGLIETPYERANEPGKNYLALARIFLLPGGFRLLVGRDLVDRESLRAVIAHALVTSLLWLAGIGTVGGIIVARRVLHRVDAMTDTATTIMTGDLSRRLPTAGTGDELDRLAMNLNAMLDRIGELMAGVKQVSDNIAHDLRTPLTRLRNGAEQALRTAETPDDYRLALDKIIEESDRLMSIFTALLMIARVEASARPDQQTEFDLADVVRDVVELYEPLAEEARIGLNASVEAGMMVLANRELIGQALANLLDNALKYGRPALSAILPADAQDAALRPCKEPQTSVDEPTNVCLDHGVFGSNRSKDMNVIESKTIEHDVLRKPVPTFRHHALVAETAHASVEIVARRAGSMIDVAVCDHGPGIAPEDRLRVLDRFVRLEGARTRPGSGLGLSLVAAVARLHQGDLRIEDNAPGLRAVFVLPASGHKMIPVAGPTRAVPEAVA